MSGADAAAGTAPTGRRSYRVEARAAAPVEAIWPLVGEALRWQEWSFLTRTALEREGVPAPDGVGAVRRFTRMGIGSREEVLAWDPPHHLAYTIVSGFPVRNYRADLTLESEGDGTRIRWSGTYDEKWPGSASAIGALLAHMMQKFATDLARYAEGRHRQG
jgi:hypothetical protein